MRLQIRDLSFKTLNNQPLIQDLRICQGDTFTFDIFFVDVYNYFFPHTMFQANVMFTAKRLVSTPDGLADIKKDTVPLATAMGGEVILQLEPEDTNISPGNYIYSIKIVEHNGRATRVMTGNLCIDYDVTQRSQAVYES